MLLHSVLAFLQGELANALIYLAIVVALDVLAGVVLAFKGRVFTLRKLGDFVVTTVGFEKTVAFIGAVVLLYLRHDQLTAAVVTALAGVYATAVLPDLYDKLSALLFAGKLPLSSKPA